jgi:dTDP-4-amino-4,6-dideoxygalactose transaminase
LGRILVLSDSAHGFGASYCGKMSGAVADFTAFSFHAVKNLTTAEGGAVTWNKVNSVSDEEIYKDFMLLTLHGQSKDALAKTKLGSWEYDVLFPAYKCNMTDIIASIGLVQMKRYGGLLRRRKELIKRYHEMIERINLELKKKNEFITLKALCHETDDVVSSGHLYLVRIIGKEEEYRNKFITFMAEKGIAMNVHYKPLPMLTAYKNLGFTISKYPNAYEMFKNEVTFPLHTCLTDEQMDYIEQCCRKWFLDV